MNATGITEQVYTNGINHLMDEKKRLDLILSIHAKIKQLQQTNDPAEQLRGLIISDVEINQIINHDPMNMDQNDELSSLYKELKVMNERIQITLQNSIEKGIFLPIPYLLYQFKLSSLEEKYLLFALAPELDKKYEKLFAYIQNDVNLSRPTIDLLLKLTCSSEEEKANALSSFHNEGPFYHFFIDYSHFDLSEHSLMSQQIKLDQRIISFIFQSTTMDKRLHPCTNIFSTANDLSTLLVGELEQEKLIRFIEHSSHPAFNKKQGVIFYIHGHQGAGKTFLCKQIAKYFDQPILIIDFKKAILEEHFPLIITHFLREAILSKAMIVLENIEVLFDQNEANQKKIYQLLYALTFFSDFIFITTRNQITGLHTIFQDFLLLELSLQIPTLEEREILWQNFSSCFLFEEPINCSILASKFRFTPGQIESALYTSEKLTEWNTYGKKMITKETLYRSCYLQVQHTLKKKATRIEPRYTWDDLILPDEEKMLLRHACNQITYRNVVFGNWRLDKKLSYGKGLSILLSGPPGTGKTMSAEVIAKDLNLEIYRVDLSQIVNKYIGETEKNLKELFEQAQMSNAILFFDESDALFNKRSEVKDSKDKYANLEVSFLLQKIEEYDGITILATNYLKNIDEAFLRRISYVIKYPFPDEEHREKIWRTLIPAEAPTDDIDYTFLANKINLAGGNIKNIIVSAAFLAAETNEPISMKHIIYASKHEMQKSGKILLREDLGEYYDVL